MSQSPEGSIYMECAEMLANQDEYCSLSRPKAQSTWNAISTVNGTYLASQSPEGSIYMESRLGSHVRVMFHASQSPEGSIYMESVS